jgi:hypothetical protein
LVLSDRCSQDCLGLPFPNICAVAEANLSGTFFLTHQTPCSFCLSDMLTSIVYTTELYHLGRFKRLIVQDIQAFQGLRGTLALPTGLESEFPPSEGKAKRRLAPAHLEDANRASAKSLKPL